MSPKKTRPRVNEPGSLNTYVRLSPDLRRKIERLAKANDRSMSAMLKVLIGEAVKGRSGR